ncbi:hypothetical protein [Halorarius halobius]|uniref:hypothetical protein n=1 Tax=Halorarius halobius TaxID=2962671 RepID=UPI0020CBF2E7|nr:hypothetical protein [Halorarius halobius]
MRRRALLAGVATAVASPLAGCSPCGETWTGIDLDVTPTALRRIGDGWQVDARVDVSFQFGRQGAGFSDAALAAFDADGRLVGARRLGDLTWSKVPDDVRSHDDCGSYGGFTRTASVDAGAFPRVVGLRFRSARGTEYGNQQVARYAGDDTPTASPSAAGYERVGLDSFARPSSSEGGFRLHRGGARCERRTPHAEVDHDLYVEWARSLRAERFHPVLAGVARESDRMSLTVGLRAWPRFRRLRCLRQGYTITGELPEGVAVVEVRHVRPDGSIRERRVFEADRATLPGPTADTADSPTDTADDSATKHGTRRADGRDS